MRISEIVGNRAGQVVTITPDHTVKDLLAMLDTHRIGAVVVSSDGVRVDGIVSERDVVRHLHRVGPQILDGPVSAIMTSNVRTIHPEGQLDELERTMTDHRIRHVPVVLDGKLYAIVSIGDVVKNRIESLQAERDQLMGYIQQ